MKDLSIMVGRDPIDSQHDGPRGNLTNVNGSYFRYTKTMPTKHLGETKRKSTKEDNKNGIHFYFESNHTQRRYRKQIMVILI